MGVNGVILLSGRSPQISRAEMRIAVYGLRNGVGLAGVNGIVDC